MTQAFDCGPIFSNFAADTASLMVLQCAPTLSVISQCIANDCRKILVRNASAFAREKPTSDRRSLRRRRVRERVVDADHISNFPQLPTATINYT